MVLGWFIIGFAISPIIPSPVTQHPSETVVFFYRGWSHIFGTMQWGCLIWTGDRIFHPNPITSHKIPSNHQHNPISQPNMCVTNYNYLPIISPLDPIWLLGWFNIPHWKLYREPRPRRRPPSAWPREMSRRQFRCSYGLVVVSGQLVVFIDYLWLNGW